MAVSERSKKVEIIVSTLELEEVLHILNTLRVSGYTVIKNAWGQGERGTYYNDLGKESSNSYIMTVCQDEKQINYLIEEVLPIIKRIGGIFLVSDTFCSHY
jgi:nitrogen regulatory protein PII